MVLDRERMEPNPARDKQVKLPRVEETELNPPTAERVEAVYRLLPQKHRLPLLFLDWSGSRVGAIDQLLVGDYDELRRRVRMRKETTKTKRGLWVDVPEVLAERIEAQLGPRDDRELAAPMFPDSGADALRTSIKRACKAAGVPDFSRMTSGTAACHCSTCRGCPGRGSVSS